MGRPRKHNRHLPANMQMRHGAYYFVRGGKWTRLAPDYGTALLKYAELVGTRPQLTTVKDAVWAYIEHGRTRKHQEPLSEATLANYRVSAANLCAVFGHIALVDLEKEMVARYLVEASAPVQANRDKSLLSAAYSYASLIGAFKGVDPTKKLQFRNQEKPRDRYVEDEEMTSLLAAASPKMACIARFIELTGMRQGDALRVKMSDLDAEGIHYATGKSRGQKRLVVLWSPELEAVVDDAKRLWRRFGREYLFESHPKGKHAKRGPGPYTPSGLRALWRRVRTKAKIEDARLHDLRRKAGSDSASDQDAQRLLGHADPKVTRRHYRAKPDRVKPLR
jgi:integrase